jgi:hypothetical protein
VTLSNFEAHTGGLQRGVQEFGAELHSRCIATIVELNELHRMPHGTTACVFRVAAALGWTRQGHGSRLSRAVVTSVTASHSPLHFDHRHPGDASLRIRLKHWAHVPHSWCLPKMGL